MRLIDADALKERILEERDAIPTTIVERYSLGVPTPNKHGNSMRGGIRIALRCMEQTPTIEAEPVVRCGECVRRYTELCSLYMGQMNGNAYFIQQGDDFFCKKGQRLNDNFGGAKTITIPKWEG